MVFLTIIWFAWEGAPSGRQEIIRETENHGGSSSPVFSVPEQDEKGEKMAGTLVCSTANTRRKRPLPDLFARSLPKQGAEKNIVPEPLPVIPAAGNTVSALPSAGGVMSSGTNRLVLLKNEKQARACGLGDEFDGWHIVYIGDGVVGLEKNGQVTELKV